MPWSRRPSRFLKQCTDINFTGSIEAREIPHGGADVIVCEAFAGNVILKLYEGTGAALISMVKKGMMSSLRSKIGALLGKAGSEGDLKGIRCQPVWRCTDAGTERSWWSRPTEVPSLPRSAIPSFSV